ncbi:UDP-N-acetylglucosamine transferase subunit [Sporothrix epigloea]|uniref:UDP-N-acetylglucosamine transferase subunit ALG14 n=1 Tax=Sporothrix epigloea TaxID=1892477 RepID=A0ABP0DW09_9PEZI
MGFVLFSLVGITVLGMLLLLVIFRIYVIKSAQRGAMDKAWKAAQQGPVHDNARLPRTYIMYVLGSGGHTGELCEMIKQQFRPNPRSHRRYLITSGDRHSINAVERLEGLLSKAYPSDANGTSQRDSWDIVHVVRARRVHQPLYTAWFSALQSALSIVQALLCPPEAATGHRLSKGDDKLRVHAAPLTHPNLIVTNGPGTGFIVCLMAFVLKILGFIPTDRCCVLFIETWAHVSTLSLTGKLFYYSRIADLFAVQHEPLAEKTGKRYIGDVTRYGNLLGIRKPFRREVPKSQPEEAYVT